MSAILQDLSRVVEKDGESSGLGGGTPPPSRAGIPASRHGGHGLPAAKKERTGCISHPGREGALKGLADVAGPP